MYTAIQNFKFGLDSRRSELSSMPGSLVEALDGHITQGGEFEKRKAFVPTALSSSTFGFQETNDGIYVFGVSGSISVAAPLIYQQIQHPKTLAGLGAVALSGIVSSTQIDNFPFVVALFADGSKWCYYNGTLVTDFLYGYVASYMTTNSLIAAMMTDAVNASGDYTAVENIGSNAHEVDIFSQPGNGYNSNVSVAATCNITVSSVEDVSYTGANVYATGTANANAVDGSTITLGGQSYRFKTVMAQAFDVQIAGTIAQTVKNLYLAIGATGSAGVNYYAGTTANTIVYAQGLVLNITPTFKLYAFTANTQGVTQNDITNIGYTDESETVDKQIATQAVGQFAISQITGSTYSTATITITGTPIAEGDTLTIAGVVYTFRAAPSTARDIKRNPATVGSYTVGQMIAYCIVAIVNGSSTYVTDDGHTGSAGVAGVANASAIADFRTAFHSSSKIGLTATAVGSNPTLVKSSANLTVSSSTLIGGITNKISTIIVGTTNEGILSSGTISTSGVNVSNGDTVQVGGMLYTFVSATPNTPGQIYIGANAYASLTNLILAINGTGTQNLNYNIAAVNSQVTALATLNGNVLQVNSRVGGTAQNSIPLATTAVTLTCSGAFLSGGLDSVSLIPAPVIVQPNQTINSFSVDIYNAINGNTTVSGYYAKIIGNVIYIYSFTGNTFSNGIPVIVTVVGAVCIGFCAWEFNSGTLSVATTGAITGTVLQIQINGQNQLNFKHALGSTASNAGSGTANSVDTSISGMCSAIAADLNGGSTYIAIAVGNEIYLSKLVTSSDDPALNVALTMTAATTDSLAVSPLSQEGLVAVASPAYIGFIRYPAGEQVKNTILTSGGLLGSAVASGIITGDPLTGTILKALGLGKHKAYITANYSPIICSCKASGGYPPYTYLWQWIGGDNGFRVSDETNSNVTFARQDNAGSNTAYWVCAVTDSLGNTVNSNQVKVYQP